MFFEYYVEYLKKVFLCEIEVIYYGVNFILILEDFLLCYLDN